MNGKLLIQQLRLRNFLSYGQGGIEFDLLPLNVLIGPNGSGKSNLIEALAVIHEFAGDLAAKLREGGGAAEFLRKSSGRGSFSIGTTVVRIDHMGEEWAVEFFRHHIEIEPTGQGGTVTSERVNAGSESRVESEKTLVYETSGRGARIRRPSSAGEGSGFRPIPAQSFQRDQSILTQRRDPEFYREITYLADVFAGIAFYREWTFGTRATVRAPQATDLPTDALLPNSSNLALVLHELLQRSSTRQKLIEYLHRFYASARHISTRISGGTVQLFIEEENDVLVPATRLSDGTLRYLSLLAILCHPTPPPIVCIEEPELGLHPDIMPTIAELLLDASQRTQLIVTTHSDALVSALSEVPECIVVCEPGDEGTQLRRLDKDALAEWLSRYSLGEIWRMGEIGGTRW